MLQAERKFLWADKIPSFQTGLALSGGGIRAATVSLGVLQALAVKRHQRGAQIKVDLARKDCTIDEGYTSGQSV